MKDASEKSFSKSSAKKKQKKIKKGSTKSKQNFLVTTYNMIEVL